MRILRVIPTMDPQSGGPCQGIRNSIPAQESMGVINEVVCFDSSTAEFQGKDDFRIYRLGPAVGPYSYCASFASWLKENLLSYDIVVIHGLWLYHSYGTFKVWRSLKDQKQKVPDLYVMPHGMLDPYFQKAKSRRLKAIRNWVFWKMVEKNVINGTTGLLFTCEQELNLAKTTFTPYYPKKEFNVGYGVPLPPPQEAWFIDAFEQKCEAIKKKPYFLFLSRIHPKKGAEILINAYIKLLNKFPGIPDLVIAGPGKDTNFGQMLQKIAKGYSIHFPGMLEAEAKWGAFYGCEAFLLPSHQENFGIAVVEAMACGKAVLISDQVNIFREIQNGDGGLISTDTEEGVHEMLCRWISLSEEERRRKGRNSKKVYHNHYAIEKAARRMVRTLKNGKKLIYN